MASLMLRKSSKDVVVGRSKPNIRCKKHPTHKQSPGVCSICLREKLSQLSLASSSSRGYSTTMKSSSSSSSSLSSYYYSSSASSCCSPMHRYDRFTTEGKNSLSSLLFGSKNVLSRSLILVPRMKNNNKEGDTDGNGKKKQSGFLSKLLRPRSKKIEEVLVHSRSRTMREIRVTR